MISETYTAPPAIQLQVVNHLPEMVFDDPTPTEVPVKIGGKQYLLREATETIAVEWQNSITSKATFDEDGKPKSMGNLADARPKLLSRCLLEVRRLPGADGTAQELPVPVPEPIIRSWSSRITIPLYDQVMEMSALAGKDTEESLTKKIGDLQRKLDKLRAASGNGKATTTSAAGTEGND